MLARISNNLPDKATDYTTMLKLSPLLFNNFFFHINGVRYPLDSIKTGFVSDFENNDGSSCTTTSVVDTPHSTTMRALIRSR